MKPSVKDIYAYHRRLYDEGASRELLMAELRIWVTQFEKARLAVVSARRAAIEEAAGVVDQDGQNAMNSLHCGSRNNEYREAHQIADFCKIAAERIRALLTAPEDRR